MAASGRSVPRKPGPPAGVIFGCNRASEDECLNGLFGMSSGHWGLVKEILPGTPCFLFNFNTKELHGVFKAVTPGGWNLDPLAFGGKQKDGSSYPAQVRVEYCPRCPPMEEHQFRSAIAENYFNPNRFRWELQGNQVEHLLDLFLGPGAPWPPTTTERVEERRGGGSYYPRSPPRAALPPPDRYLDRPYSMDRGRYGPPSPRDYRDRGWRRYDDDLYMREPAPRLAPPAYGGYDDLDRGRDYGRPLPDERYPLGPPDEPLGRPLAVSRGLDGPAAYGAPLTTAVPDDPFGLRSTITPATSGPSLTVARPAVTGLEPQQVLHGDSPSRILLRDTHAQNFDYDAGHTGLLCDRWRDLSTDQRTIEQDMPVTEPGFLSASAEVLLDRYFGTLPPHPVHQAAAGIVTGALTITVQQADDRERQVLDPFSLAALTPTSAPPASPLPTPAPSGAPGLSPDPSGHPQPQPMQVQGTVTTFEITNLPKGTEPRQLVDILDEGGFTDQFDMLLLGRENEDGHTTIINFREPSDADRFREDWEDTPWPELSDLWKSNTAVVDLQVHSVQGRTALEAEYKSSPYGMRKYVGPPSVRDHQLVKFKALFFFHAKRRATSAAVGGVAAKSRLDAEGTSAARKGGETSAMSEVSGDSQRAPLMPTGQTAAAAASTPHAAAAAAAAEPMQTEVEQPSLRERRGLGSLTGVKMEPLTITAPLGAEGVGRDIAIQPVPTPGAARDLEAVQSAGTTPVERSPERRPAEAAEKPRHSTRDSEREHSARVPAAAPTSRLPRMESHKREFERRPERDKEPSKRPRLERDREDRDHRSSRRDAERRSSRTEHDREREHGRREADRQKGSSRREHAADREHGSDREHGRPARHERARSADLPTRDAAPLRVQVDAEPAPYAAGADGLSRQQSGTGGRRSRQPELAAALGQHAANASNGSPQEEAGESEAPSLPMALAAETAATRSRHQAPAAASTPVSHLAARVKPEPMDVATGASTDVPVEGQDEAPAPGADYLPLA